MDTPETPKDSPELAIQTLSQLRSVGESLLGELSQGKKSTSIKRGFEAWILRCERFVVKVGGNNSAFHSQFQRIRTRKYARAWSDTDIMARYYRDQIESVSAVLDAMEPELETPVVRDAPQVQDTSDTETERTTGARRVFISHARATPIVNFLEDVIGHSLPGINVWTDLAITGGKWGPQILGALDRADALVLVGTPRVLSSIYSGFELGYVDQRLGARKVFILRAGTTTADLQKRPPLGEFQHYGCEDAESLGSFLDKLARELSVKGFSRKNLAEDSARFKSLIEEEIKVGEDPSQISLPRTAGTDQVTVLPASVENLLRARKDIDQLEQHLNTFDSCVRGKDWANANQYHEWARNLFTARAKTGVPEGNLRSRFDRLSKRLDDATDLLLQGL